MHIKQPSAHAGHNRALFGILRLLRTVLPGRLAIAIYLFTGLFLPIWQGGKIRPIREILKHRPRL